MKVQELIEILSEKDPNAEVRIMCQPSWPFEYDLLGVVSREEFDSECSDEEGNWENDISPKDVFIVQGGQLRYGDKGAWSLF